MMPGPAGDCRVFLRPGPTDMRKAVNGLCALVQNELHLDPYERALFAFCNRRAVILKILYWDRNGFCLWQKRLEKDRFPWPADAEAVLEISREQLNWLLNGIDFRRAHRELSYDRI